MKLDRKLTWLLRHAAYEEGLTVSPAGWISITEVLKYFGTTLIQLSDIVREDKKQRFEINSKFIRACQGHSNLLRGLSIAKLERSWHIYTSQEPLWHSTKQKYIDSIMHYGLIKGERTHVHLASSRDSNIGKRQHNSIMLRIDSVSLRDIAYTIYEASNGVILTLYVPPICITIDR